MKFRLIYFENSGAIFPSEILLDAEDAAGHLATEHYLHQLAGWNVERCGCGLGFIATKKGKARALHLEEVEGDPESIALALGLLQPASKRTLEEVTT